MRYFSRLVRQSELVVDGALERRAFPADAVPDFEVEELVEVSAVPAGEAVDTRVRPAPEPPAAAPPAPAPSRIQAVGAELAPTAISPSAAATSTLPPDADGPGTIEVADAAGSPPGPAAEPSTEYVLQRVLEWIAAPAQPAADEPSAPAAVPASRAAAAVGASAAAAIERRLDRARHTEDGYAAPLEAGSAAEATAMPAPVTRSLASRDGAPDAQETEARDPARFVEDTVVSIGSINVSVEAPEAPEARRAEPLQRAEPPAAGREARPAPRLARHYLQP
jgi:hypothetical protein